MKKKVFTTILLIFIFVSCAPATQIKTTATPISTSTMTITSNPTFKNSPTAKPTITPSLTPDYSILGYPSEKINYLHPSWLPNDYFAYDDENYFVFSRVLHGTEVIVAIDKDNKQPANYHEIFAEFSMDTFHLHWGVFEGTLIKHTM